MTSDYYLYLDSDKNLLVYKCFQFNETNRKEYAVIFRNAAESIHHIDRWMDGYLSDFVKTISPTSLKEENFTTHYKDFQLNCSTYKWNLEQMCYPDKNEDISLIHVFLMVCAVTLCLGVLISVCKREDNRVYNISD